MSIIYASCEIRSPWPVTRQPDGWAYVYSLSDPRDSKVYYVGSTQRLYARFKAHRNRRLTNKSRSPELHAWITEVQANGLLPLLEVVERVEPDRAVERERYWIAYFAAYGEPLVNIVFNCSNEVMIHPDCAYGAWGALVKYLDGLYWSGYDVGPLLLRWANCENGLKRRIAGYRVRRLRPELAEECQRLIDGWRRLTDQI
jgi:hypothetical protein